VPAIVSRPSTLTATFPNDTGIFSRSETLGTGDAGRVAVTAGALSIANNGMISSATYSPQGNAGNVVVTVADLLSIVGTGGSIVTGIADTAGAGTSGNGGKIRVEAGAMFVSRGGSITASTDGSGDGGAVVVRTAGSLDLTGAQSGIFASARADGTGNAGNITVAAGTLTVSGGAGISTGTAGPGAGGDIHITADEIVVTGVDRRILARSIGSGNAGSIDIVGGRLSILNGAAISTEATAANGGNITLSLGQLLYLDTGQILMKSSGEATGSGGNITIAYSPLVVLREGSRIDSSAVGGNGGNITINAGSFLITPDSAVDAHSQMAISGTIEIEKPRADLNGSLVVLPGTLESPAAILREACAARTAPRSSLSEGGRGGLPEDLDLAVPALYFAGREPRAPEPGAGPRDGAFPLRTTFDLRRLCR
jgi:large exoprotein involved in heme utilization and adhesion